MNKGVFIGIIVAMVAVVVIFGIVLIVVKPFDNQANNATYSKNQEAKIKEEDITIKVNSVEQENKRVLIGNTSEDYVKVNITIKNNSNRTETVSAYSFCLIDSDGQKYSEDSAWIEDDDKISGDISNGSSISGNLFFKTKLKKGMELQYTTIENAHMGSDGHLKGNYKYYKIKID